MKIFSILSFFKSLICYSTYQFSRLIPKKKNLWIFGDGMGNTFSGNPKYLFLYISNNIPEIKPIWITHSNEIYNLLKQRGYNVFKSNSLKAKFKIVRAKILLFGHSRIAINKCLSSGININVMHGCPFKKSGIDNIVKGTRLYNIIYSKGIKRLFYRIVYFSAFRKEDYFCSTSKDFEELLAKEQYVAEDRILTCGFSRTDVLLSEIKDEDLFTDLEISNIVKKEKENGKRIIFYIPTFRDLEEKNISTVLNFSLLDEALDEINAIMVCKLHIISKSLLELDEKKYNNIFAYRSDSDIYPLLKTADLLITDYSSIYFDYLFLDKPIIFFPYDYDYYLSKERGFYFDYKETIPGEFFTDFSEFIDYLKWLFIENKGEDDYSKKRNSVRNMYFDNVDYNSSKRTYEIIVNKVLSKKKLRKNYN
ncbi:MAG: CDP-glycerol glycerophosphotransferase family protein [Candidatus Heimdallarchaeota archaeon]|nr:CDP-glycerol glycerophosphotransferase family protein [Candidatus Heimdallarchaeota archaeon]MCK4611557.1 CDP-glycerol glycerophosphotransferase family protein [Candidatus Heimdallarchaeota archaeon]